MVERPERNLIAPILAVLDPRRALEVYERVFGFQRLGYFDGNDEYLVLGRAGFQVHLMKAHRANPNHANGAHVADMFIWVEALEDIVASARAAGLAVTRGPERYDTKPIATTEVVIEDLDGYWLCFAVAS